MYSVLGTYTQFEEVGKQSRGIEIVGTAGAGNWLRICTGSISYRMVEYRIMDGHMTI